ncbi:MAG: hypothetical protein LBS20_08185 [Prevotella sp.]|jgi:hypothetical protein|nr:hypothetical protein [Prevotella sp.]
MSKIVNKWSMLPVCIKGMVFAMLIIYILSSCCVTGYCQTSTADDEQTTEATNEK